MRATRVTRESAVRVSECVSELLKHQPFFGSLALRLPLRPDPSRETLACDGREIRFSPQWVADQDAHLVKTAIGRVVLACALKHHTRRDERQPERWQKASQLVTHSILRDSGFTLPPEAEAWDNMSVEEAYDRLGEEEQDDSGSNGTSTSSGAAGDGGAASSPPDTSGPGEQDDNQPDAGGNPPDSDDDSSSGSGDDSTEHPDNSPAASHDPSGTGEVMDAQSRDQDDGGADLPFDVSAEERDWDQAMHQAASIARAEGNLPGSVEDTVNGAHRSALDWQDLLRRYMRDAMARDYSWSVPNRRFIDQGIYLPSIRSDGIDTIVFIIDTSISIWSRPEVLAMFWSEIRQIATEISPERIFVLQVDVVLQKVEEFSGNDLPDELILKGKGGTDFRPGFEWLADENIQPGVCVYFTDMECTDYPDEPTFPVIWCDWGGPSSARYREPWGERIGVATS